MFEKIEVPRRPLKHYCFGAAYWMDFEALGARFWPIFGFLDPAFWLPHPLQRNMREAFQVEGLTLMIRATRGRSMDGWMDG